MSRKLSPDGKFLPFPGWTVISPVRAAAKPYGSALDNSQALWTNLLFSALHMIRTSSCSSNFACLPDESLHMTITGLTDECLGVKPLDLKYAPWEEVEAELIVRSMGHFTHERLGRLASTLSADAITSSSASIHMVFKRILVSSIICVEFECLDNDMDKEVRDFKHSLLTACGFDTAAYSHNMAYHITLAYRTRPTGDHTKAETTLQKRLNSLFESLSTSSSSATQNLILNPPIFACFPDMTEFPTSPLYAANQPLQYLLDGIHAASHTRIERRLPGEELPIQRNYCLASDSAGADAFQVLSPASTPSPSLATSSNLNQRVCAIIVLGRALEGGKVTLTLEKRLCRAYQAYMEAKHDNYFTRVVFILTGGFSEKGSDMSEAKAMKEWLLGRFSGSIPTADIFTEEDSLSTVENALFVRRMLINKFGLDSCVASDNCASSQGLEGPTSDAVQELRAKVITTSSHIGRSAFIFTNLLRLPKVQLEFLPCEEADARDVAVETTKLSTDWGKLVARSLSFTSAFNYTSVLEMCKRNRIHDLQTWMSKEMAFAQPANSAASTPLQSPSQSSKKASNSTTSQQSLATQRLAHWVNVLLKDREGNSPLHIATLFRRHRIVTLLLEQCGANLSVRNANKKSPLDMAIADVPDVALIKLFLNSLASNPDQHAEIQDSSKGTNGNQQKSEKGKKGEKTSNSSVAFRVPDISTRPIRCDDFATLDALYLLFDMFHRPDTSPKAKSIFLFSITESWLQNLQKLKNLVKLHKLRVQDSKAIVYLQEEKSGSSSGSTSSSSTSSSLFPTKSIRDALLTSTSQTAIIQPTSTIVPFTSLEDVDTSLKDLMSASSSKPKTLFIFLLEPSPTAIASLLTNMEQTEKQEKQASSSDGQATFVYKCVL